MNSYIVDYCPADAKRLEVRDIAVLFFTAFSSVLGIVRPWMGVLALAAFAYLNPHRYAWGFSSSLPVYQIVFIATLFGLLFNAKEKHPFPWSRETKLFVALLVWYTVTTIWNPDYPSPARDQWVKVMKVYLGIFPTFWLITSRKRLKWLVVAIALSFGLIGLKGGIFALATGFRHRVWGPSNTFYGGNNEIGLALNMSLPLLFLCSKEFEKRWVKWFFLLTFAMSIFSIVSTWSRGALLTLCTVLGTMIFVGKKKWLAISIVMVVVVVFLPMLPDKWFARMNTIGSYQEDESALGRLDSWSFAIERAMKNPLTGGGFDCFIERLDSHSAYFQVLAHHGFVGFGLWLSLLFGTIFGLGKLSRRAAYSENCSWINNYARAIQISLLAYSVGGAFLGVAYWDIFYHLIAIYAVMKMLFYNASQLEAAPQ